ncbi:catalytic domain-containing protein [Artemisia annua]|uniref:Catalytic domain-containing protein n=1 Tax=Artemisia annua TaxID=35608 RepID=A0A2U1LLY7_ARTAN|nr:catalytic domain-containing protein [Artemisia annua]
MTECMTESGCSFNALCGRAADMLAVLSKKQVVLVGKKSTPEMEHPSDDEEMRFWEEKNPNISAMAKSNFVAENVVALVCKDFACKAPVTNLNSLEALLLSGKA